MYLSGAPGVAGPFGSLPGSDGLKTYAGSVSCGMSIWRSRLKAARFWFADCAAAAASSLVNLTPSSVCAALIMSALIGPVFCGACAYAFAATAPATAVGTAFRNFAPRRPLLSPMRCLLLQARGPTPRPARAIGGAGCPLFFSVLSSSSPCPRSFFSLNPAGIATSASVAAVAIDSFSCDEVRIVVRCCGAPLLPIIFLASMPLRPPPPDGCCCCLLHLLGALDAIERGRRHQRRALSLPRSACSFSIIGFSEGNT